MCAEVGSRNEQLYPKELAPAERRFDAIAESL